MGVAAILLNPGFVSSSSTPHTCRHIVQLREK